MPLRSRWTSRLSPPSSCKSPVEATAGVIVDAPSRKPNTALGDPWPAPTILPKLTQIDDCGDYESELAVVIGKTAKNVSEANALDYVLGYTACNDVSSRTSQLNQSQWSFSKGFDGACPIGMYPLNSIAVTLFEVHS